MNGDFLFVLKRQNVKGFSNAHNQHFSSLMTLFLFVSFFIFSYFLRSNMPSHKSLKINRRKRIHCDANPFKIKGIFDEL